MAEITITIKIENNGNGVTVSSDATSIARRDVKEPAGSHIRLPDHFLSDQSGGEGGPTDNSKVKR